MGRLHLLVGVTLCLPLVALGLSGSILVVHHEIIAMSAPGVATGAPRPIFEIIAAAQAAAPAADYVPSLYVAPATKGGLAWVRLLPPGGKRGSVMIEIDPVSLKVFPSPPPSRWLALLHDFHENLMLSTHREVGWLGIAMLVLGMSGLVSWWPWRSRWRQLFVASTDQSSIGPFRRLHATMGLWSWLIFMTVSVSGVCLAFPQTTDKAIGTLWSLRDFQAAGRPVYVAPAPGAQAMSIDDAVALAQAEVADTKVDSIVLPLRPGQPDRIRLLRNGLGPGAPAVAVLVDPWTRQIVRILDPSTYTFGERVIVWEHAIHSGEGLGAVWNLVLFLTGLLPLFFITTGLSVWWAKRQRRLRAG